MLSKWSDHDNLDHRVKDDYERNRLLIDLRLQPADLVEKWDQTIADSIVSEHKKQVGIALMKFCNLHGLVRIEKAVQEFSPCLSSVYNGPLLAMKSQAA